MPNSLSIYSLAVAINFIVMGASLASSVSLRSEPCFRVVREPEMQEWANLRRKEEKMTWPITREMVAAIDRFYFNHYCQSFRSGAFARANSSMYVRLGLYLADLIIRVVSKPYGEYD